MPRGGFRPGAGRPKSGEPKVPKVKSEKDAVRPRKALGGMSPLEYMLGVMCDEDADPARRDRMAMAAAPYVHAKPADAAPGKKEQKQAAAEDAASGRNKFAPPSAPKLVVSNK